MSQQEQIANPEIKNDPESFVEKLKSADKNSDNPDLEKVRMEDFIKRNKEKVQKSENALEKVHERLTDKPQPSTAKEVASQKEEKEKQKDYVKFQAKDISSIENPEDQIMKIVDLASKKDPYFAIKVAKHMDNNYILDRVHDNLIEDQVRDVLVKKGLLEEIR